MNIEIGDFSVFPLKYLEGRAPEEKGEISLSFANAAKDGLNKKIGDEVTVKVGWERKDFESNVVFIRILQMAGKQQRRIRV